LLARRPQPHEKRISPGKLRKEARAQPKPENYVPGTTVRPRDVSPPRWVSTVWGRPRTGELTGWLRRTEFLRRNEQGWSVTVSMPCPDAPLPPTGG